LKKISEIDKIQLSFYYDESQGIDVLLAKIKEELKDG